MKQVVFMPLIVATLRDSDKAKRGDQVSAAPYDIAGLRSSTMKLSLVAHVRKTGRHKKQSRLPRRVFLLPILLLS
jgi:hypothetical protein